MRRLPAALTTATTHPFGLEIRLDLARGVEETAAELRRLLWKHHWLLFRDQALSFDQQVELMNLFGPVSRGPVGDDSAVPGPRDYVSNDTRFGANLGTQPLAYHHDNGHCPKPMIALSLFAVDVEDHTTATHFIDSTKVYRSMSREMRDRIARLEVLNVFPRPGSRGKHIRSTSPGGRPVDMALPHAVHPLVMKHPKTSEKLLFANEMMTDHILGMDDDESDALLGEVLAVIYRPAHVLEHWWSPGDFVVWDNLAVQHGRADQQQVERRTLRRVVCADASVYEQFPHMRYDGTTAVHADY